MNDPAYRVVVYPRDPGNLGSTIVPASWETDDPAKFARDECERIKRDIYARVPYIGRVEVEATEDQPGSTTADPVAPEPATGLSAGQVQIEKWREANGPFFSDG